MSLKFGLALMNDFPPQIQPSSRIAMLREQTRAASAAGIDSVWVLQHYLGSMPTLQPVHLLSALAQDAGDMKLGTNMYILPLRHPVGVAEEFSTLDHITNGNAIAGFGWDIAKTSSSRLACPWKNVSAATKKASSSFDVYGVANGPPSRANTSNLTMRKLV